MTEYVPEHGFGQLDIARIQKDMRVQGFRLYLGMRTPDGFATVMPVMLETRENGGSHELAGTLTSEAAQRLFDDLWEDGLRPSTYQRDVSDEVAWLRNQLGLIIAKEWK